MSHEVEVTVLSKILISLMVPGLNVFNKDFILLRTWQYILASISKRTCSFSLNDSMTFLFRSFFLLIKKKQLKSCCPKNLEAMEAKTQRD